jgi:hypothetical protein
MQRRGLLARLAALGVAALAGCTEASGPTGPTGPPASPTPPTPTDTPTSGIVVESWDVKNGTDGSLIVPIVLKNTGDRTGSRKVLLDIRAGDESVERTQDVTVPAGETKRIEIDAGVTYKAFLNDGAVDLRLEGEG